MVKDEGVRKRQHLEPEPFPAKLHLFSLNEECRGAAGKKVRPRELKHSGRERRRREHM